MYDGTVTFEDPNLIETFDIDEQTRAYVLRDIGAEAPDEDGIGAVYRVSYPVMPGWSDQPIADSSDPGPAVDVIAGAWDRFRDHEMIGRYLRAYWDVVSFDYSTMLMRDGTVYALVTRTMADAWGVEEDSWPDLAGQAIETYRRWAEGEARGIIVVNTATGEESSLWGVYGTDAELRSAAEEIAPIGVAL